jgi:hypothetical protein
VGDDVRVVARRPPRTVDLDVDVDVDVAVDVDVDVDVDGDRVDPPAVAPDQDSAGPSTDDDVTAQCEDRRAIVRTTLDES